MPRYRKIDPRIWNDEKFRALSDDGKLAFLLILTHPYMTALGAMRARQEGLAAELDWSAQRFCDAISDAIRHGMVEVNEDASYIGLPNFLRYNEPEGPNSVKKAWIQALDLIPECQEKKRLMARCRRYLDAKSHAFRDAIGDGIWDAFRDAMSDPGAGPGRGTEKRDMGGSGEAIHGRQGEAVPPLSPPGGTFSILPPNNGSRPKAVAEVLQAVLDGKISRDEGQRRLAALTHPERGGEPA